MYCRYKKKQFNSISNLLTVKYPLLNYYLRVTLSTGCCSCQHQQNQNSVCWVLAIVIVAPDNVYYHQKEKVISNVLV